MQKISVIAIQEMFVKSRKLYYHYWLNGWPGHDEGHKLLTWSYPESIWKWGVEVQEKMRSWNHLYGDERWGFKKRTFRKRRAGEELWGIFRKLKVKKGSEKDLSKGRRIAKMMKYYKRKERWEFLKGRIDF